MPTITVNSRKYDRSIRRSWTCELLGCEGELVSLVGEFAADVEHPDLGVVPKGTLSYESFWLDRWYSIFRFEAPDGKLRNYYCNLNMPPCFAGHVLDYVDLDIDIVIWPDGRYKILDLQEFGENAIRFGYPESIVSKTRHTLEELIDMIEKKLLPGPIGYSQKTLPAS